MWWWIFPGSAVGGERLQGTGLVGAGGRVFTAHQVVGVPWHVWAERLTVVGRTAPAVVSGVGTTGSAGRSRVWWAAHGFVRLNLPERTMARCRAVGVGGAGSGWSGGRGVV